MESRYTLHITSVEWRWVIVCAVLLVFLVFLPFLWVALSDTQEWQFMGALHNYQDGGSYLSKIAEGEEGSWLVTFRHTPEDHGGAFIQVLYPALGQLARLISIPTIIIFHVARVGAALIMYLALYYLAASIWQRVRTRRIFFALVSLGAGFGWLLYPISNMLGDSTDPVWPDLQIPEAFPLSSTMINVHFPLSFACLALIASLLITALRPGSARDSRLSANLILVALLSLTLAFLFPQALFPLGVGLALFIAVLLLQKQTSRARHALKWLLALVLPALPVAAYYAAVVTNIPAFTIWNRQNVTEAPPPLILILGFGLPLLIALPGIVRAARRFEQEDDRLMLLWLVAMVVLIYLPTNIQRRFAAGMMIPIAYFATRAIEDFWFQHISRRFRTAVVAVTLPLMVVSPLLSLFLPVAPVVSGNPERSSGIFLERDYARAFQWLFARTQDSDVVLAAPPVSLWIPVWARARVVYGHPYETLDAAAKRAAVAAWYADDGAGACADLLERYNVRFVIVGAEERKLGAAGCTRGMVEVFSSGQVRIYAA